MDRYTPLNDYLPSQQSAVPKDVETESVGISVWNKKAWLNTTVLLSGSVAAIAIISGLLLFQDDSSSSPALPIVNQTVAHEELRLTSRIEVLEQSVEELTKNLLELPLPDISAMTADLKAVSKQLDALPDNKTAIEDLTVKYTEIQRLVEQLRIDREHQTLVKHTGDEELHLGALLDFSKPPFRLVSIEIWNAQPTALLMVGNKMRAVSQGDFSTGWKILAIDPAARIMRTAPQNNLDQVQVMEVGS